MHEDWTIDLAVGTAAHIPTGPVLELVKDDSIGPPLHARHETTTSLVAVTVERLLREGTIALREAQRAGGAGCVSRWSSTSWRQVSL